MGLVQSLFSNVLTRQTTRERLAFMEATKTPRQTQHELLWGLIRQHARSAFGRDYGFGDMSSLAEFRSRLGLMTYDDYEPYIDRVRDGEIEAMFCDETLVMFALSSGTTQTRKYIPVTQRYLDDYRRSWRAWGLTTFETHPDLFLRSKVGFGSAAEEFRTPLGVPCGNLSGLTAQMNPWIVRQSYCLPTGTANTFDAHDRCYLNWRVGLNRDIGMCVAPNPGLLLQFGQYGSEHHKQLIREVHDGTCQLTGEMPKSLRAALKRPLRANRRRAAELEQIVSDTGGLKPRDVWPALGLLCCWLGGPTRAYVRRLAENFGDVPMRDIGLIASEARMTLPKDDNTPGGILDITSTFFEFIPADEVDAVDPTVLEASEIELGQEYYLLITTTSGLYRYQIHDAVRVTGFYEQTPIVEFLHKGSRVANLFGEKISESQVVRAVQSAAASLGLTLGDFSVSVPRENTTPRYHAIVECSSLTSVSAQRELADAIDRALGHENYLYAKKRDESLLEAIEVVVLPAGTWRRWDRQQLEQSRGTQDQYKHPFLITDYDRVRDVVTGTDAGVSHTRPAHVHG